MCGFEASINNCQFNWVETKPDYNLSNFNVVANHQVVHHIHMTEATLAGSGITLSSFKPTVIPVHDRSQYLEFERAASSVGMNLKWPFWRITIEVGSKTFQTLMEKNEIPNNVIEGLKLMELQSEDQMNVKVEGGEQKADLFKKDGAISQKQFLLLAKTFGATISGLPDEAPMRAFIPEFESGGSSTSSSASSSSFLTSSVGSIKKEEPQVVSGPWGGDGVKIMSDGYGGSTPDGIKSFLRIDPAENERLEAGYKKKYIICGSAHGKFWPIETTAVRSARTQMWEWMTKCLMKGTSPGPFSHLVDEVNKYDVAGLFLLIKQSCDVQNVFTTHDTIMDFWNAEPERSESIFAYFTRLEQLCNRIAFRNREVLGADLDQKLSEVNKHFLVVKMLKVTAHQQYGQYKGFVEKLKTQTQDTWMRYTVESLKAELRVIHDSGLTSQSKNYAHQAQATPSNGGDRKGRTRQRERGDSRGPDRSRSASRAPSDCPKGICWDYWGTGVCPYSNDGRVCAFKHERRPQKAPGPQQRSNSKQKNNSNTNQNQTPRANLSNSIPVPTEDASKPESKSALTASDKKDPTCRRCGGAHTTKKCNFEGTCGRCGKPGHKKNLCKSRVQGEQAHVRFTVANNGGPDENNVEEHFPDGH